MSDRIRELLEKYAEEEHGEYDPLFEKKRRIQPDCHRPKVFSCPVCHATKFLSSYALAVMLIRLDGSKIYFDRVICFRMWKSEHGDVDYQLSDKSSNKVPKNSKGEVMREIKK